MRSELTTITQDFLSKLTDFEDHVGQAPRTKEDYKTILSALNNMTKRIAAKKNKQKITFSKIRTDISEILSPGLKAGSSIGITAFLMSIIILQTWGRVDPSTENQDMGITLDWIGNLPYYNYDFVKMIMDELSIAASDSGIILGFLLVTLGNMARFSWISCKTCVSGRDTNGYTKFDGGDDEENQTLLDKQNLNELLTELTALEDNIDRSYLDHHTYQKILTELHNISKRITAKANHHKITISKTLTSVWVVLTPGLKAGTSFGIAALIASFVTLKIWGKEYPSSENNDIGIVLDWMSSLQYYNFNFIKIMMDELSMAAFASGNVVGFSLITLGNALRMSWMRCKTCISDIDNDNNTSLGSDDEDRESLNDNSDPEYFDRMPSKNNVG